MFTRYRNTVGIAIVSTLLFFARTDLIVIPMIMFFYSKNKIKFALIAGIPIVVYLIYNFIYFNGFMPISGRVKMWYNSIYHSENTGFEDLFSIVFRFGGIEYLFFAMLIFSLIKFKDAFSFIILSHLIILCLYGVTGNYNAYYFIPEIIYFFLWSIKLYRLYWLDSSYGSIKATK